MGRGEVHTGFWWVNLREGVHLEDTRINGKIIVKLTFVDVDLEGIHVIWPRVRIGGVLL
jgi:hypothetical protein